MKNDIHSREDIELLMRTFYGIITKDETIGHYFTDLDLEKHFPVMIDFWSSILLDTNTYKGNAFEKHILLGLKEGDFTVWLHNFNHTVDTLFEGEKASLAKQRAESIAWIFKSKLPLSKTS